MLDAFLTSCTPGGDGDDFLVISRAPKQPEPTTKELKQLARRLAKTFGVSPKTFAFRGRPHPENDEAYPLLKLDLSKVPHLSTAIAKRKAEEIIAQCVISSPSPRNNRKNKSRHTNRRSLIRADRARFHSAW